jgi:hypothetical protein
MSDAVVEHDRDWHLERDDVGALVAVEVDGRHIDLDDDSDLEGVAVLADVVALVAMEGAADARAATSAIIARFARVALERAEAVDEMAALARDAIDQAKAGTMTDVAAATAAAQRAGEARGYQAGYQKGAHDGQHQALKQAPSVASVYRVTKTDDAGRPLEILEERDGVTLLKRIERHPENHQIISVTTEPAT